MKLVLHLTPNPVELQSVGSDAPYPLLMDTDDLHIEARAGTPQGLGATETSNMRVLVDNAHNRFTRIVPFHLRVRAELFDDDDFLAFEGIVATSELGGTTVALGLEV